MMPQDGFRLVQTIEDSESLDAVLLALKQFARAFGYDRYVLFSVAATPEHIIDRIYWAEGDWFADGTTFDADTYMLRCPVTRHVFETPTPFFWTKTGSGDDALYRVVDRPRGTGLHGLQIPVFGPSGLEGAVSLGGESITTDRTVTLALTLVGAAALRRAKHLTASPDLAQNGKLSRREREVLGWIAAGRRQMDIAATLGLSERTIENHLRRIRLRLGARTTAEAVRIAIRIGAIEGYTRGPAI